MNKSVMFVAIAKTLGCGKQHLNDLKKLLAISNATDSQNNKIARALLRGLSRYRTISDFVASKVTILVTELLDPNVEISVDDMGKRLAEIPFPGLECYENDDRVKYFTEMYGLYHREGTLIEEHIRRVNEQFRGGKG